MTVDALALQAGLDGYLGTMGIENPVSVETEVAVDGDPDIADTIEDFLSTVGLHNVTILVIF